MFAILALSVALYSRCFRLLLTLRRQRRALASLGPDTPGRLSALRLARNETYEVFRSQRMALGAMVAAAPLLGLLGTVSGMVRTFESLAGHSAEKTMEGLARGISEVLVATESGLVVAIPGLLAIHIAQRYVRKYMQELNRMERGAPAGGQQ
jgi:biopolymer transport protein ExbB